MSIYRAFFGSMPKVGDVYEIEDENPFKVFRVRVVETSGKWIKYCYLEGDSQLDGGSSLSKSDFNLLYKKVKA